MSLFDSKSDYVRLDDDVSFQLVRTNPKLTTNIKLMYDGENIYMDSYSATPLLATTNYKNYTVLKTGFYNCDVKRFLLGSSSGSYSVNQDLSNTVVGDNYDNQFENMYWCGVESINSSVYPQEMGFVAPLYIRKKLPNYFVIFKVNTPANTNFVNGDETFDFKSDVLDRTRIIKSFDLREGTPIGDYIRNYVGQKDFKYDQSLYVNFGAKEFYYYGIDKSTGVLCQKVENFDTQLLKNDNTIMKSDEWITCGFERNNLIFPYILNLEFLFDDNETEEYQFARYFGMYCNDITFNKCLVEGFGESQKIGNDLNTLMIFPDKEDANDQDKPEIDWNDNVFYYIKNKKNELYSLEQDGTEYTVIGDIDQSQFTGYELDSFSVGASKIKGYGYAMRVLTIDSSDGRWGDGYTVYLLDEMDATYNEKNKWTNACKIFTATKYKWRKGEYKNNPVILPAGEYSHSPNKTGKGVYAHFSCQGTDEDIAVALAGVINDYGTESGWVKARAKGNHVIIQSRLSGSRYNGKLQIKFSDSTEWIDNFYGGTDNLGCLLKISAEDVGYFAEKDYDTDEYEVHDTYLKCYEGRPFSKVEGITDYLNGSGEYDENYLVVVCDSNGRYVNTGRSKIEILHRFHPLYGALSFFPVKDFDFDTIQSSYGEDTMMKNEINKLDTYLRKTGRDKTGQTVTISATINLDNGDEKYFSLDLTNDNRSEKLEIRSSVSNLPYSRFVDANGKEIDNEYDYFCENFVPELTTVSKTAPYITKWGYMDEEKDSCENPYRLNMSKIFDTCNFSANTFMQESDIYEYTHSLPYYAEFGDVDGSNNEYQYVEIPDELKYGDSIETIKGKWRNLFSSNEADEFDKLFGDASSGKFTNKRFNKKYSRFLLGSDASKPSTLFRGVKFELVPIQNDKEINTSKYNGYKFSLIYVPVSVSVNNNDNGNNCSIFFIKNDTFKFILGVVFINTPSVALYMSAFDKIYMYSGALGYDIYTEVIENEQNTDDDESGDDSGGDETESTYSGDIFNIYYQDENGKIVYSIDNVEKDKSYKIGIKDTNNLGWTVKLDTWSGDDWIELKNDFGSGDSSINISISSNNTEDSERYTYLKLCDIDGNYHNNGKDSLKISQKCVEYTESDLVVTPTKMPFDADGTSDNYDVSITCATSDFNITNPDTVSWVSWKQNSTETYSGDKYIYTFTCSPNKTTETRKTEIVISLRNISKTIVITQTGADYNESTYDIRYGTDHSLTVQEVIGTYTLNVIDTNELGWTAKIDSDNSDANYTDYIDFTGKSGKGDGKVNIIFKEKNTTTESINVVVGLYDTTGTKRSEVNVYLQSVNTDKPTLADLEVNPDYMSFVVDGTEGSSPALLTISCTKGNVFIMDPVVDWITLEQNTKTQITGTDFYRYMYNVECAANKSGGTSSRTTTLTVGVEGVSTDILKKTVSITQLNAKYNESSFNFMYQDLNSFTALTDNEMEITVTDTYNLGWVIKPAKTYSYLRYLDSSDDTWKNIPEDGISGQGDSTFKIKITEDNASLTQRSMILNMYGSTGTGEIRYNMTIYQDTNSYSDSDILIQPDGAYFNFTASGGTSSMPLTIGSKKGTAILSDPVDSSTTDGYCDWVHLKQTGTILISGTTYYRYTYNISCDKNTTGEKRTATITVRLKGVSAETAKQIITITQES